MLLNQWVYGLMIKTILRHTSKTYKRYLPTDIFRICRFKSSKSGLASGCSFQHFSVICTRPGTSYCFAMLLSFGRNGGHSCIITRWTISRIVEKIAEDKKIISSLSLH